MSEPPEGGYLNVFGHRYESSDPLTLIFIHDRELRLADPTNQKLLNPSRFGDFRAPDVRGVLVSIVNSLSNLKVTHPTVDI